MFFLHVTFPTYCACQQWKTLLFSCNGKSPAQHIKPELLKFCHKETQWNGFAVISIAPCPDWELLKRPPLLEGVLITALHHKGWWQDLAHGSRPLSVRGLKNPFAIGSQTMGRRKEWQGAGPAWFFKELQFRSLFSSTMQTYFGTQAANPCIVFSLLFPKRQFKFSFNQSLKMKNIFISSTRNLPALESQWELFPQIYVGFSLILRGNGCQLGSGNRGLDAPS